jgi:hypothetical protein
VSLLWKIRNQKEIQVSEKRKELESGGSDALADISAKIEFQRIHKRSYHPSVWFSAGMFPKRQSVEKGMSVGREI